MDIYFPLKGFNEKINVLKASKDIQSNLGKNLNSFRADGTFCDVVFTVNSKDIYAHKSVLSATNPYFRSLFNKDYVVSKHEVKSSSVDIFQSFINFLYTGVIEINNDNVFALSELCAKYVCDEVLNWCAKFMQKNMTNENCIFIKNLADRMNLNELSEISKHYIIDNYSSLINSSYILTIPLRQFQTLLSVRSSANRSLVDIICAWVRHKESDRKIHLESLFKCLNWKEVNEKRLESIFSNNIYLEGTDDVLALLSAVACQRSLSEKYTEMLNQTRSDFEKVNIEERDLLVIENIEEIEKFTQELMPNKIVEESIPIVKIEQRPKRRKTRKGGANTFKMVPKAGRNYKCLRCPYSAHCQNRISEHFKAIHMQSDNEYECSLCKFKTCYNREFYNHMKDHYKGPPYKCDHFNCTFKAHQIYQLVNHQKKHSGDFPYECHECNKKFSQKGNLNVHLRMHSGEKSFSCDDCGKKFRAKNTLKQHLAKHSKGKPFLCDQCPFSTKYQSHLASHRRTHDESAMFYCNYEDCNYKTYKKCILKTHLKKHSGIKEHVCSTCGKAFMERSHLIRHERIHSGDKPFKCDRCNYTTGRSDKLKLHLKKHESKSIIVPTIADTFNQAIFNDNMMNIDNGNIEQTDLGDSDIMGLIQA